MVGSSCEMARGMAHALSLAVFMKKTVYSREQVELISGQLLSSFIPKDPAATALTFHFTMPPESFKVTYQKNEKGQWVFCDFERVEI